MKHRSRLSSFFLITASLAVITLAGVVIWKQQFVHDWILASQFSPSTDIAAIVDATTMNDRGRLVFYATQPTIEGTQVFNDECGGTEPGSMVLGCYVNDKIYIYDADDKAIDGIEEVTAAHEMLHAAYERMSPSERETIERLLASYAASLQDDEQFVQRLEPYSSLSEADRLNELHSIFATEYAKLPSELEQHYERYFTNRQRVVAFYEAYSDVFRNLQQQSAQLASQLDSLATAINQRSASYRSSSAQLSESIDQFNARASRQGGFTTQAEFDAARAALEAESSRLDTEYQAIQALVAEYENVKGQYDGIVAELSELNDSIDSRLAPAPAVQ